MDARAEANLNRMKIGTTYEELREQPVNSARDASNWQDMEQDARDTINWQDMEQESDESTITEEKP